MTLDEIATKHQTDKATSILRPSPPAHGYAPHYDRIFTPLRNLPIKLLEIGVSGGESIRTWLEYFPDGIIYGVDIVTSSWKGDDPRYTLVIGDQSSADFWEGFIKEHGHEWDIIIDDGSHWAKHIITSFNCLWPRLKSGGFYCIEDLETSYWPPPFTEPEQKTQMDLIKGKMDEINREGSIEWLHFSKELAVMKKG